VTIQSVSGRFGDEGNLLVLLEIKLRSSYYRACSIIYWLRFTFPCSEVVVTVNEAKRPQKGLGQVSNAPAYPPTHLFRLGVKRSTLPSEGRE